MNNNYATLGIWAGAALVIFAVLWYTGNLVKIRNYVLETREELRKCTWPTFDELRGSTIVVMLSILLLGVFTVVVDRVIFALVDAMTRI